MTQQRDTCGCNPEPPDNAPRPNNAPGLAQLAYRVARYPNSLARLVGGLAEPEREAKLTSFKTREPDDPMMGLLDATAVVADVLSFYSERIANEGYLRTATERRSLLELSREIGYELGPGLAAEAWLVFNVEDRGADPSRPGQALVPLGTRVQSVPSGGGRPQTFETWDDLNAQAAWNELRLVTTAPQVLNNAADTFYLAGTSTGINEGDVLLVAVDPNDTTNVPQARVVHRMSVEADGQRTRIELSPKPTAAAIQQVETYMTGIIDYAIATASFNKSEADATIGHKTWSEQGLSSLLEVTGWQPWQLATFYAPQPPKPPDLGPADPGIFAFKHRASVFGHNAPKYDQVWTLDKEPYPKSWETEDKITTDSQGKDLGVDTVRLDSTYKVVPSSWVVVSGGSPDTGKVFRVTTTADVSLADFAISGKATQLTLQDLDQQAASLAGFTRRSTSVYAGSLRLELAEVPLDDTIDAGTTSLDLDRLVPGLDLGRVMAVSGERADVPGTDTEIITISSIVHAGGRTTLTIDPGLVNPYVRRSVTISANVVRASHGETIPLEILGGGSGAADQRFRLRRPPVTYVSASTGSGSKSTLTIRIDGVKWMEASTLEDSGPRDERYLVRRDDDGGTNVVFGDGINGARPQTGAENVAATYRSGIGVAGLVPARSLTLLASRPPGIRDVTNPIEAQGAEDPETRDSARVNAPLTVTTLGRVVSLTDYGDFARAFGGIGKASATQLWRGRNRVIHITVAGPGGTAVADQKLSDLRDALDDARDPGIGVEIAGFTRILARVRVDVLVDPALEASTVATNVRTALGAALSFDRRAFVTPLTEAEVIAVVMGVKGVRDSKLLALYAVVDGGGDPSNVRQDPIVARPARWVGLGADTAPAELVMIEPAGATVEVRTS